MTDQLSSLAPSLKNALAVPGSFDTTFPDMSGGDILQSLMNGMAEAMLDGFFPDVDYTDQGALTRVITRPEGALVVIYASAQVISSQLRNTKASTRAKAGPVEFETTTHASVLTTELKRLEDRKKDLRDEVSSAGAGAAFFMADRYMSEVVGWEEWGA